MSDAKCLLFCLSLATGEFLAAQLVTGAEAWPVAAGAAVLAALFGYGLAMRGWPYVFVALVGLALYLHASVESERRYREQPWMRGVCRQNRVEPVRGARVRAVRREFSRRLGIGLSEGDESAALSRAMILGERERLPFALKRKFVLSGSIHLFAISGLHVAAVAKVLLYLMALTFLPRRWCGVAALPFLWGYVFLIGWPPSAVRAALMASFVFLAPVGWRRPNLVRAWAVTFLLVHLADPLKLSDVASLLSFAVMLAILLAVRCGAGAFPPWGVGLWVSLATWAAGVPIAAAVFGRVTPGGLLANAALVPVASGVVFSGAVSIAASFVGEAPAAYLNHLSALGVRLMVAVADAVSRLPGANLDVPRWGLGQCAAWYVAVVLCFVLVHTRRKRFREVMG